MSQNLPARNEPYTAAEQRVLKHVETRVNGVEAMLGDMPKEEARAYIQSAISLVRGDRSLLNCDPNDILYCLQTAAMHRLAPGPLGLVWFIAYGGKLQFQLGLSGVIELARRWDPAITIKTGIIHENDDVELEEGLVESFIIRRPRTPAGKLIWDRGAEVAYYAVITNGHGGQVFHVMSKEEVTAHAKKYSKSYGNNKSPWQTSFSSMAQNTVAKRALKMFSKGDNPLARGMNVDGTTGVGVDVSAYAGNVEEATQALANSAEQVEPEPEEESKKTTTKTRATKTTKKEKTVEKIPDEQIEDAEVMPSDPVEEAAIREQEAKKNAKEPDMFRT